MGLLQSRQQKLKQREKDLLQQSRAKTTAKEAAKSASTPSGGFSYLDQGKLGQVYDTQSSADQQRAISGGAKYFEDTGTFLGTLGSSSGRGTAPASYGSARTSRTPTSRTTSEGANRGEAGRSSLGTDTVKTRFDGTDTQVDRTAGVRVDPMQQYMDMFSTSPADRMKAVRDSLSKDRRTQIDSIEKKYNEQVRDEEAAGKEDLARMRSMNLRAGLGGSDFGAANKQAVRSNTRQNISAIDAKKDIEIGGVLDTLDQLANQRFQLEEQAMQSDFSNMMAIEEYRAAQREQATEQIAALGKAGFDVATIKERDPQLYESMSAASGMGDVEMEAVINNAKATANKIDYEYKVAGNKLIAFGIDPMTGTLKMLEQEVDIPENYGITTMPDGTVLAVPDNFDGDVTKIKTIGNYAKPATSTTTSTGGTTPQMYSDDLEAVFGTVMSTIPSKFGQETFANEYAKARSDEDRLNIVAAQVLRGQSSAERADFASQAVGISEIEKAITLLEQGAQTGLFEAGAQYLFNLAGDDYDPNLTKIRSHLVGAIQPYRNSVTGAAWGRQEEQEYQDLFGTTRYTPEALLTRLYAVKELLKNKSATALNAYANPLGFGGTNVFATGGLAQDNGAIRTQVDQMGYDYDKMIADGYDDEQIMQSLGLQ